MQPVWRGRRSLTPRTFENTQGSPERLRLIPRPLWWRSPSTSGPPRCLNGGDVDLLHRHHRVEDTLCLTATNRNRVGERPRGDLPREPPAILAPAALTLLAA